MTKKLISCLLIVVMLFTMAGALAEPFEAIEKNDALEKFIKETDLKTKDIVIQLKLDDKTSEIVLGLDGDNLHMVGRENGAEKAHVQLNPTAMYVKDSNSLTMLRYDTVITFVQDLTKDIVDAVSQAIESIPKEALPTEEQLKEAIMKEVALASAVASQERADAVTLLSAAAEFASKFKPEYVLDAKEEYGSVTLSLRGEAFATALGEAMDGLMSNPGLAELVDRQAALNGGVTFAALQQNWLANREATLQAISTIESSEKIEENGHWNSHFEIGEGLPEGQALSCDMDTWIDADNGALEMVYSLGFKDQDPLLVYEIAMNSYRFWEKLTADDSLAEFRVDLDNGIITKGNINIQVEGKEELTAYFGPDYMYMKGPKGGMSTSVRETWTGKTRYELFIEDDKGQEANLIIDFYEEDDSLICEVKTSDSDQSMMLKISRTDKAAIDDLSAAENITEITGENIKTEFGNLLMSVLSGATAAPAEGK